MGKLIGQRWKNIDPDRLSKYSEMASEDTERYKKEMQSYNGRQEAKMRSEALKPPASFPARTPPEYNGATGGGGNNGGGGSSSKQQPADAARSYYPEGMGSAFATPGGGQGMMNPAAYNPYAMDFSAYAGMGMYNPYAGYGMGAAVPGAEGAEGAAAQYGRAGAMYGQFGAMMGSGSFPGMMGG